MNTRPTHSYSPADVVETGYFEDGVHDGTRVGVVVGVVGREGRGVVVHFPGVGGSGMTGVRTGWHGKFTVDDNDWIMFPVELRPADLKSVKVPLVRSHKVHAATEQAPSVAPEGATASVGAE